MDVFWKGKRKFMEIAFFSVTVLGIVINRSSYLFAPISIFLFLHIFISLREANSHIMLTIMELEQKIFSRRIFHLNQIRFWTQNRNRDKLRGPDSSLFEAISPMFYILRIIGLAPYRFSKDRLVSSNAHLFFSFFALFINTYVMCETVNRFLNDNEKRAVLTTTERGKVIFNYITLMTDILITMWTRNEFVKVWNIIQDFDQATYELGFPQSDKKTKFWLWVVLIINFLNWLWINQTGMYAFFESFVNNFSYMYIYIETCYSVFKFSGMAVIIGQRFKHLNKIARKCSPNGRIAKSKIDSKTIEKLLHDLMVASENLNSMQYWSLLLWLFNISVHAVSSMYFIIEWMIRDVEKMNWALYSCLIGWLVVHIMQLVILHSSCHFASTEANRIDYILLNWHRWQSHYDHEKDFQLTVYLMNYKLNFSAAGCCYVNLPLLRSITGLLTTYLVILLQLPN